VDKVHLIHRRDEFRASKIMVKRAEANPKIQIHLHSVVADLKGKPHPMADKVAFFKELTADLVKPTNADPELYHDWGDDVDFSLKLGRGECAA